MSAVSDGAKKSSSDAVAKGSGHSISIASIPTNGSSGKTPRREKGVELTTPQIAAEPASPRTTSPTKAKGEKSSSSGSSKSSKSLLEDKSSGSRDGKVSTKKLLREELASAHSEVFRLRKENEELREQLATLQGVISIQTEQKAMTKKQQRRHKQKQQAAASSASLASAADEDSSDEEEFGDDQETEMFDKAASSDDTQVKRKLQEHKRTRSIDNSAGVQALVDADIPPKQRRPAATAKLPTHLEISSLSHSMPGTREEAAAAAQPEPAAAKRPRPTRPTNTAAPPRNQKFATATNLSRTFISQEDEKELIGGGSGNDAARGRIMNNFALVSGEATPNSLKIGVLGTPDPNAPKQSSSNDDHPHIFDENTVLDILCGLGITSSRQFDDSSDGSVLIPKDYSYSYQFKVRHRE